MTPKISSFGTDPCRATENRIKTHGRNGALKTKRPRKLNRVSGFFLLQIYTSVLERAEPRNGMEKRGAMHSKFKDAYARSQEKCAGDRPDDSSSRRE